MAKIDRDAAIAVMFRRYHEAAKSWNERGKDADYGAMVALDRAGNELSRLPAEEDRPAFRWVPSERHEGAHECGSCGALALKIGGPYGGEVLTRFCPHCGAELADKAEEESPEAGADHGLS